MSQSDLNSEYVNDSFHIPDYNLLENSSALEEDFAKKFDIFNFFDLIIIYRIDIY